MDQEIDLREIVAALLKYKFWIAGLALVAAAAAAIISLLQPSTYEASALVVVTKPQYELQFDSRIRSLTGNVQPAYKAYPVLARSDAVVAALVADLGDELTANERSVDRFRKKLDAENASDPSIIRLTVKDGNPDRAARVTNVWADQFVETANELYAQRSDDLDFFTAQKTEAEAELDQAEAALSEFEARNRTAVLQTQLLTMRSALTNTLKAIHPMEMTIQDARALRDRLTTQERSAAASPSDELTALLIEVNALNQDASRVQLQLSLDQDLGSKSVGDQIAFLDSLIVVLGNRLVTLQAQAAGLEPRILTAQQAYQDAQAEQERLTMARELAYETFDSLSRKAAEVRIEAQDTTGDVRIASHALPVPNPVAPRKTLNTLIAGAVGLLVGVVAALAIEYWKQGQTAPSSD
jgi:uncharacterized protein involved in exopolysaccharide biosynthesis